MGHCILGILQRNLSWCQAVAQVPFSTTTHGVRQAVTPPTPPPHQLTQAVFPEGTPGSALDALARLPLWSDGLNYRHGTGVLRQ